jgi:hypothetical protein
MLLEKPLLELEEILKLIDLELVNSKELYLKESTFLSLEILILKLIFLLKMELPAELNVIKIKPKLKDIKLNLSNYSDNLKE